MTKEESPRVYLANEMLSSDKLLINLINIVNRNHVVQTWDDLNIAIEKAANEIDRRLKIVSHTTIVEGNKIIITDIMYDYDGLIVEFISG